MQSRHVNRPFNKKHNRPAFGFVFFLARRFFTSYSESRFKASAPAVRVAMGGIAVGIAVMLITVSIVTGFKQEVSEKVTSMASDALVTDYRSLSTPDAYPILTDSVYLAALRNTPGVAHVQTYTEKVGLLKTNDAFRAVTLKGLSMSYDTCALSRQLVAGHWPKLSKSGDKDIVISLNLSKKLNIQVGDRIYAYFFENTIKTRRFRVAAIYNSNLKQFDDFFIFTNKATVNKLNGWQPDWSGGVELSYKPTCNPLPYLKEHFNSQIDELGHIHTVLGIHEDPRTASIFDWLGLLDMNIWIILSLMILISAFSMMSGLLILILERTSTIGLLKSLGMKGESLRRAFLVYASLIIFRGLFIGNLLAGMLLGLQYLWHPIPLDPIDYYVSTVPVAFGLWWWVAINVVAYFITLLVLLPAVFIIGRVDPAKTMRVQ